MSKRFHSAGFDMSTLSDGWHRLTVRPSVPPRLLPCSWRPQTAVACSRAAHFQARCDGKASYFYVDTKLVSSWVLQRLGVDEGRVGVELCRCSVVPVA